MEDTPENSFVKPESAGNEKCLPSFLLFRENVAFTPHSWRGNTEYETWVSQAGERRRKFRRETILLAVLRTEEIFEADVIWDNGTWQIRVLNPRNYQWSESLKRKIRTEIRQFSLLLNEYGGEKIPPIEFKPSPAEETGERPPLP